MALRYLVDTNIVSELERTMPESGVVNTLLHHQHEIALSAISWHELWYGYHQLPASKRKLRVGEFLTQILRFVPVLPYNEVAAEWFAQERGRLRQIGLMPSYPDGQIAATAVTNHLVLVTRNVTDFAYYQELTVENWFK